MGKVKKNPAGVYWRHMRDMEHEEWLENRNARKAEAKQNHKTPPVPPKTAGAATKKEDDGDDQDGRVWRGEAA